MTDDPTAAANADDELVAAYLADDLDGAAAAAFEQRLEREPALVARLDALADALVVLGGHDDAALPEGFDDRLSQRLTAERAPNVTTLSEHRDRKDRGRVWLGLGTAAAVLAAGALMAGNMMQTVSETAGESAGGSESADEGSTALRDGRRLSEPVIVDRHVAVSDEDALRRLYESLPEAEGLLGTPVDEAVVLAERFGVSSENYSAGDTSALESGDAAAGGGAAEGGGGAGAGAGTGGSESAAGLEEPASGTDQSAGTTGAQPAQPEASGAAPNKRARASRPLDDATVGRCLAVITKGATATLVPVRVESMRYGGVDALSYVFVTAAPESEELDRVEVWVVRRSNCATLVFQQR